MNLRIIKAGVQDTIQDLGRYGWQHAGINTGGAMDRLSAQIANILVGNDKNEALLELHYPASAIFFEQPVLIALSGADFTATVNGEEIPHLQPVLLSKYSILQFHRLEKGARSYLAIAGGLNIPTWLDSYSTHLKAAAGGYRGRILQKDDEIPLKTITPLAPLVDKKEFLVMPWKADTDWEEDKMGEIAVLIGNEWEQLSGDSKQRFLQQSFMITVQSDRMGYRLKSTMLTHANCAELVSSAVSFGTVQLLPDGQLIVLMADHQTTGGYPRIAHVVSAHHSRLAQMRPGDRIRFRFVEQQVAEDLLIRQSRFLQQLQHACQFKLEQLLNGSN